MSYIAPLDRTTGTLISASIWNINVDDIVALYGGALSVAGQATNDFLYAASATQIGRVAAIDGMVPRYTTGGGWAMAPGSPLELLKANSGSDTNASATTVDTYALASILTAKDTLLVFVDVEAVAQATAGFMLRNETDTLSIGTHSASLAAGEYAMGWGRWRQSHVGATRVLGLSDYEGSHPQLQGVAYNYTTPWTGAWTIGLRHGGVTGGGTCHWSWSIYIARGQ